MKKNVVLSMLVLFLTVLVLAQGVVYSQDDVVEPIPESTFILGIDPIQNEDGLWFMPTEGQKAKLDLPQNVTDSGGPDDFGYTWTDNVALNWVSASGGIDTGLASGDYPDYTGAVNIGFPFKFYENTYSQLYISRYGFLSFDNTNLWNSQSQIPSPEPPNDVIAPHWVPADGANYIRFLRGGTVPNRYFVVEWNQLRSECCGDNDPDEIYTFETILYENGDIKFQYGQMTSGGSWVCQAGGIEDMTGLDGLEIKEYCDQVASNHAVRITRPSPSVRVRITPSYGGSFAHAGKIETFEIVIRNAGEFGADTYDLFPSFSAWTTNLYEADGVTPLTDTDGDTIIDTGPINQASQTTIVAKVETPTTVAVGDYSTFNVVARSSINTGVSNTAEIRTAVPTRFGLISMDDADDAIDLSLYQSAGRTESTLTPDNHYGSNMAVTNTPDAGFVSTWTRSRMNRNGIYVREIIYSVADKYGDVILPAAKLTRYDNVAVSTYDYNPAVAVTPDGHIGVLWYQSKYQNLSGSSLYNYNIYFAILSANGDLVYGPANLTGNTLWGRYDDNGVPQFNYPTLAATGDNRFIYGWQKRVYQNDVLIQDIYFGVRSNMGAENRGVTALTNAPAEWGKGYLYPNLATISNNRALMMMSSYGDDDILGVVIDSNGNPVIGLKNISNNGTSFFEYQPDAVQLANGKILAAWYTYDNSQIQYALLDTSLNILNGPNVLYNNTALVGENYVSVTKGPDDTGILTWMDDNWDYRPNLYYALVDGSGSLLTVPTIIESSEAVIPRIESSMNGYGNAEYTWAPPTQPDPTLKTEQGTLGTSPGGGASIFADFANYGEATTNGLKLTAVLDSNLTYTGDDSGISPTVQNIVEPNSSLAAGQTIIWDLPDMNLFDREGFTIFVDLAESAPIGSSYPVSLTLTSDSDDADASNNQTTVMVWSSHQVYLPTLLKSFD